MFFLVHYDRTAGKLVTILPFNERGSASAAKLEIEIDLLATSANGNEVVLLEATDEDSLRKTHRRYFDSLSDMKEQRTNYAGSRSAVKYWNVSLVGNNWRVQADGQPEAFYPDKEHAIGAAAKDARDWHEATGKPAGFRVRKAEGSWQDESVFGIDGI